jgi:hypothetical protein
MSMKTRAKSSELNWIDISTGKSREHKGTSIGSIEN